MTNLAFSTTNVRAAHIKYAAYRDTASISGAAEAGNIDIIYNTQLGTWDITRDYVGDAFLAFNVTNAGQIQITPTIIAGATYVGTLTFEARALVNS